MATTTPPPQPPLDGAERLQFERTMVAGYAGGFGWRSLFNAIWPLAGWIATVALVRNGSIPLMAGFVLSAVCLQALYLSLIHI